MLVNTYPVYSLNDFRTLYAILFPLRKNLSVSSIMTYFTPNTEAGLRAVRTLNELQT